MIVVVGSEVEAEAARRMFAAAVQIDRFDVLPPSFRTVSVVANAALLEDIRGHSGPLADRRLRPVSAGAHDPLMSYSQAGLALGMSTKTVGRRVSEGRLEKVGRRVTAASVRALRDGSASW